MGKFEVDLHEDGKFLIHIFIEAETKEQAKQIALSKVVVGEINQVCSTCDGYVDEDGNASTAGCEYGSNHCEECYSCECDGAC